MPDQLKVKIVNPENVLFEGEATFMVVPSVHGNLGILPGHTPLYAELIEGEIHIAGMSEASFPLESGIIRVKEDVVTVLLGI